VRLVTGRRKRPSLGLLGRIGSCWGWEDKPLQDKPVNQGRARDIP